MLEHLNIFKEAFIREFYQLYDRYQDDQIYACALIFDEFLNIDDLVLSTENSICNADEEDHRQYLAPQDRWDTRKWRSSATGNPENSLTQFRRLFTEYSQTLHSFGNPMLENQQSRELNHLKVLFEAIKQGKEQLKDDYGLDIDSILFFVSVPQQPNFEVQSALILSPQHALLDAFIESKSNKHKTTTTRTKLSQTDKDMLTDLAQLAEMDPYDYMKVAHEAYVLTLEPHFIDCQPAIQQLIQTIAAMVSDNAGLCAMNKDEILMRIEQFYPHHIKQNLNNPSGISHLSSENPITLAFIDRI